MNNFISRINFQRNKTNEWDKGTKFQLAHVTDEFENTGYFILFKDGNEFDAWNYQSAVEMFCGREHALLSKVKYWYQENNPEVKKWNCNIIPEVLSISGTFDDDRKLFLIELPDGKFDVSIE